MDTILYRHRGLLETIEGNAKRTVDVVEVDTAAVVRLCNELREVLYLS